MWNPFLEDDMSVVSVICILIMVLWTSARTPYIIWVCRDALPESCNAII